MISRTWTGVADNGVHLERDADGRPVRMTIACRRGVPRRVDTEVICCWQTGHTYTDHAGNIRCAGCGSILP